MLANPPPIDPQGVSHHPIQMRNGITMYTSVSSVTRPSRGYVGPPTAQIMGWGRSRIADCGFDRREGGKRGERNTVMIPRSALVQRAMNGNRTSLSRQLRITDIIIINSFRQITRRNHLIGLSSNLCVPRVRRLPLTDRDICWPRTAARQAAGRTKQNSPVWQTAQTTRSTRF